MDRRGVNIGAILTNKQFEHGDTDMESFMDGLSRRLIASVKAGATDEEVDTMRDEPDVVMPNTFESRKRHTDVSPEDLSERWGISINQATQTTIPQVSDTTPWEEVSG